MTGGVHMTNDNVLAAAQNSHDCISKASTTDATLDGGNGVFPVGAIMVPCPLADLEEKASMITLDDWTSIRWLHFREGKSIRWISREFKISRETVSKYVGQPDVPKYTLKHARAKPVADQWRVRVKEILEADKNAPRKQRHTARRIYIRLVEEHGYSGSERTVRQVVADLKNKPAAKASVPLLFEPGKDAQVDFGESYVDIAGQRVKLHGFE